MKLYLVEDEGRVGFQPFAQTRPVGEMLFGCRTLRSRIAVAHGAREVAYVVVPELEGFSEMDAPELTATSEVRGPCRLVSTRFVPEGRSDGGDPTDRAFVDADGRLIGLEIADDRPLEDGELMRIGVGGAEGLPETVVPGRWLDTPWQLMALNAERIAADCADQMTKAPEGLDIMGDHPVFVAADVQIGPQVVLDARHGPIRIEAGVTIEPFTHLVGPCWIGPESALLGGPIRTSSIGPRCKIRGEVDTSVVLGFANKAHDGYLGHAVVGRWVNLGAMTTNSDLKNNYSSVRVNAGPGPVDTGERKVGVFLGDHVKTGIGTLLGTGCVVGAGSNVMAGPIPPRYVPPFSWGSGDDFVRYELEKFLETTRVVMGRRQRDLTEGMEALFTRAWYATHGGSV